MAWRQTAEFIAKYFRKGLNIGINGTIQTRVYQDKDTGKNRTAVEVLVNNAYFVESKSSPAKADTPAALEDFSSIADPEGDLPF